MEILVQILETEAPLWAVLCCAMFSIAIAMIAELFSNKANYDWRLFKRKRKNAKVVKMKNDWRPMSQHTST